MADRLYKLTEVDLIQHDYEQSDIDAKGKELPSVTYTEATPSIRSE